MMTLLPAWTLALILRFEPLNRFAIGNLSLLLRRLAYFFFSLSFLGQSKLIFLLSSAARTTLDIPLYTTIFSWFNAFSFFKPFYPLPGFSLSILTCLPLPPPGRARPPPPGGGGGGWGGPAPPPPPPPHKKLSIIRLTLHCGGVLFISS